jgi:hypothetical protein
MAPLHRMLCSVLVTAALVGCGSDATRGEGGTGNAREPIINGTASGPEDDAAVWISSGGGSCSGVLVADNIVLTARHCVSQTEAGGIACTKDGKPVSGGGVLSDNAAASMAIIVGSRMKRTADAKGKLIVNTGAKNLCNNDIGIIILDRHIPNAVIAQIRLDSAPVKGETIRAVGFGVSNTGGGGRKKRVGIPITVVGPGYDMGAVAPNEFAIGEGICSGDSGGPAFSEKTGAVVGLVSRGGNGAPYDPATDPQYTECVDSADYKTHNIYTRTDSFRDLILSAFAEAGSEPWLEGGPDPRKAKLGAACDGPDACRSAICIETAGKRLCTDKCDAPDPACPAGYLCTAVGDSKLCVPAPPAADPTPPAPTAATNSTSSKGGGCAMGAPGASAGSSWLMLSLAALLAARRRRS